MTLRLLTTCSLLLAVTAATRAQSAEDFFNGGAQYYISNNIPAAWLKVEAGRKIYPGDEKLKRLEDLLKQQQQSQSQQNQQNQAQQNQNSQSKNQQSQSRNQQEQNQAQQQQQSQQQNQKSQAASSPQNPSPQNAQQHNAQEQGRQPDETAGVQNAQAQRMSARDARRLLDAQKSDEQVLQFKPKGQPQNVNPVIKDW